MQQHDPNIRRSYRTYLFGHRPMPPGWNTELVDGKRIYISPGGVRSRIHPRVFRTFAQLNTLTPQQLLTIQLWEVDALTSILRENLPNPFPTDPKSIMIMALIVASRESFNIIEDFTHGWSPQQKSNMLFDIKNRYIAERDAQYGIITGVANLPMVPLPAPPSHTPQINSNKGGRNRCVRKNKKTGKKTVSKRGRYKKTKKNNRRRK